MKLKSLKVEFHLKLMGCTLSVSYKTYKLTSCNTDLISQGCFQTAPTVE